MDEISAFVNLSRNACWRRIRRMEEAGIIKARVALVEPSSINLGLSAFVMIRTNSHDTSWAEKFDKVVKCFPEIIGAHRMAGDLDYILRVRVRARRYDEDVDASLRPQTNDALQKELLYYVTSGIRQAARASACPSRTRAKTRSDSVATTSPSFTAGSAVIEFSVPQSCMRTIQSCATSTKRRVR